ncbi:MAG: hypothetical protein EKK53_07315 [Burkholderiales bacterium]|nr:MAG: hypothetical protein EKK53_07315 [Burkholderiales bacterium]
MPRALFSLPRSVWRPGLISLVKDSARELVDALAARWAGVSATVAFGFSATGAIAAAGLLATGPRPPSTMA